MGLEVAIVGVHVTRQARRLDTSAMTVVTEAVQGAMTDAGLTPDDVDGVAVDWPGPGGSAMDGSSNWARLFGRRLHWTADALLDCAGVRGVLKAAAAIAAGLCRTVVVGGGRAGNWLEANGGVGSGLGLEFADCWGSYVMPQFALIAQRHMHDFGTTPEQLAEVAATIRNHGHSNPEAIMYGRGPYTVDDVLASPMVASPLHLLDCCIVGQGGCAVVLTSLEHARDLPHRPVRILGGGLEYAQAAYVNPAVYREVGQIGASAARRAFGMAGLTPADVDVLSLYDATSFEVIRQMEVLGFCAEGEGGPFVEGGRIGLGGAVPTNPEGGCLAHSWNGTQQMTLKVIECVRQLRGECGERQVDAAEIAIAGNAGAGAQHYEVALFGPG